MKKEDLDKTMPIDVLADEKITRSSKYDDEKPKLRSEKYEDDEIESTKELKSITDLEVDTNDSELEEKIKEVVEEIQEEKETEESKKEEVKEEIEEIKEEIEEVIEEVKKEDKDNVFVSLKKKFIALPTKAKVFLAILCGIVVALLIVLFVMLATGGEEKPKEELTPTEEEPVTVVDNYYYKDGKLFFLNEEEKEIGSYKCKNKSEKKCYVAINVTDDTLDVAQKLNHEGAIINERAAIINEDYVYVYDSESSKEPSINLYSISSETISDTYDSVRIYKDNYAIVSKNNKYGLIHVGTEVKPLIMPNYDELYYIDGMTKVLAKNASGYIVLDMNGAELSKYVNGDLNIKYYN